MPNTWFISDTHFFHKNVVLYCDRPFVRYGGVLVRPSDISGLDSDQLKQLVDSDAMNAELIRLWNSVVADDDTVYHLGDFAFGPKSSHAGIVAQLKGTKIIVLGNHDSSAAAMLRAGFNIVHKFGTPIMIELDGHKLLLQHYPMHESELPAGIDYQLCGHVHDEWDRKGRIINVGVDVRGMKPVSLMELLK